jgi:transposase InsO family protein
VVFKDSVRSRQILDNLRKEGVNRDQCLVHGRVFGIITDKLSQHEFRVHCGSFASGVFKATTKELGLLKPGNLSLLHDSLPSRDPSSYVFTDEERQLLNSRDWLSITETLIEDWKAELIHEQGIDEYTSAVIDYLKTGTISSFLSTLHKDVVKLKENHKISSEVLYRKINDTWKIVVPVTLRPLILHLAHNQHNHFDANRTYHFMTQHFYWHGMSEQTKRYTLSCLTCQKRRNFQYHLDHFGPDIAERVAYAQPGRYWSADLKKLDVTDIWGNTHILVMVDLFSRYVVTVPLKSKDSNVVVTAIYENLLSRFGYHLELLFDQGSEFLNEFAQHLYEKYGTRYHPIKVRQPNENGLCERFNRTFMDHYAKALVDHILLPDRWSEWLVQFTTLYNASYHPTVSHSPFYLLHRREFIHSLPSLNPMADSEGVPNPNRTRETAEQTAARMIINHKRIEAILAQRYAKFQKYVEIKDLISNRLPNFNIGDLVLVRLGDSNNNQNDKARAHAGPFKVTLRDSTISYLIQGADGIDATVHATKLAPYIITNADLLGAGKLAPSALGAALSRFLNYQYQHSDEDEPVEDNL